MRNFLLGLLLLASPVTAQVTISGVTLEDLTVQAAAVGSAAPDWTSYMQVVYDFEEAGDPWANADSAIGGATCDGNPQGSAPSRETGAGDFVKGTAAGYFQDSSAEGEYIGITCDGIEMDDQDVSWGGWFMYETDGYATAWGRAATSSGYQMRRDSASDDYLCQVGNDTTAPSHGPTNTFAINTWYHIVCVYDDGGGSPDLLDSYYNGADDDTAATNLEGGSDRNNKYIASTAGSDDQREDEIFLYAGVLTKAETARIGACGVDGEDCLCNGATWLDYGKTDESCLGSGNPWGCCTGVGTGCIDQDSLTDDCNKAAP